MKKIFILLLLVLPSFSLLFRFGIHSMHDFHPFRQFEYNLCLRSGVFPCRWAPDAGMGFGEPVFNYYSHFPYWVGGLFSLFNISVIDSTKLSLSLSLSLSGLFMYLLARRYWGNLGGLVSALFYIYAPYRAVDVWVRGALPEAWAFVFYPLILLLGSRYLEKPKTNRLLFLSLSVSGLIITHNLSALMFLPFAVVLGLIKNYRRIGGLIVAGILSLLLSAFYLLPVYFEQKLVRLSEFTSDLYQYQLHYADLRQLFISRFWGYGSSVWGPNDNMSFSLGHLHWIIPLIILITLLIQRRNKYFITVSCFYLLGLFAAFMTHGKSEFIWKLFSPLSYLQFPWRFLSVAVFFLSLSCGAISLLRPACRQAWLSLSSVLLVLLLLLNVGFFRPDIWISKSDKEYFSSDFWNVQKSASLLDYWPAGAGDPPQQFAPNEPYFYIGEGQISNFLRTPHEVSVLVEANSDSVIVFPIVYFPGWTVRVNSLLAPIIKHPENGAISVRVSPGQSNIRLRFTNSPARQLGNLISLLTFINIGILLIYSYAQKKSFTN